MTHRHDEAADTSRYMTCYACFYNVSLSCFFFFFSSRRRHTRFDCDWSSDVCSSDLRRYGLVDRSLDRPPSFARVGNPTGKLRKIWILEQGIGCQVQQPGCDHASTTPHFRDVTQIQVVLVVLRIAQWSGFGIYFAVSALSNVRSAQDSQPLRVCRHNSVLHSVVHHLDEMAGAVWAAVQIALLGGAIDLLPANSPRNIAHSGSERGKDWIEPLDDLGLAANHHAVTTLQTPHTSACAHIHIADLSGSEFLCPPDVVHIVRVPTVDEDVSCIEVRQKISDSAVDNRCRNHQPDSSRLCEFLNQLFERGGAC